MKKEIINQGDVMLVPVTKKDVKGKVVPAKGGRVIVAEGEQTGHHHAFYDPAVVSLMVDEENNKRYLEVKEPAVIKHEEHGALQVPIGFYEIHMPVEYVPNELPRAVAD